MITCVGARSHVDINECHPAVAGPPAASSRRPATLTEVAAGGQGSQTPQHSTLLLVYGTNRTWVNSIQHSESSAVYVQALRQSLITFRNPLVLFIKLIIRISNLMEVIIIMSGISCLVLSYQRAALSRHVTVVLDTFLVNQLWAGTLAGWRVPLLS